MLLKEFPAAIGFNGTVFIRHTAELAGTGIISAVESVIDKNARSKTGTYGDSYEIAVAPALSEVFFTKSKHIRIVGDKNRFLKMGFQDFL